MLVVGVVVRTRGKNVLERRFVAKGTAFNVEVVVVVVEVVVVEIVVVVVVAAVKGA